MRAFQCDEVRKSERQQFNAVGQMPEIRWYLFWQLKGYNKYLAGSEKSSNRCQCDSGLPHIDSNGEETESERKDTFRPEESMTTVNTQKQQHQEMAAMTTDNKQKLSAVE
ncbi:hypothetical protein CHS0354_020544 [Potamilus streckersoni]|uniref:Uncharacterized protein n=1 Tax=Potamilus streckersoni TaxID=2493646 RepID=A0AAE0SN25_9BIVA|nr:hypothetical protein CHS0354_020544 [Potamilus streckersoni]